jgi:hypothetical protein
MSMQTHIKEQIEKYQVCVLGVFDATPQFSYTIGMSTLFGFEVILFGMDPRHATMMINDLTDYLKAGNPLLLNTPTKKFTKIPILVPFKFQTVPDGMMSEYAMQAFLYYRNPSIPFVQMVMADKNGKFPEDAKYDHKFMDRMQPLLYRTH